MGTRDKTVNTVGDATLSARTLALLQALRPRQWVKNGLVFLPFLFAVNVAWSLDDPAPIAGMVVRLAVVFLAFCSLSSGVYLLNDLMDRDADRQHPVKKDRPIASGKVTIPVALSLMALLSLVGLLVMVLIQPLLAGFGLVYLSVNLAYSLGVKNLVLVDVLLVASGYVIRAGAGAVAIGVTASPWLYAVTGAGALFIVLGRRYAEVRLAGDDAAQHRSVLREYAGPFIGQLLTVSATAALVSYTLYTVEADGLPDNHTMLFTVPFVVFGLFRYLYLLNTRPEAESPEYLISKDITLMVSILSWVVVSVLVLALNG